MPTPAIASVHAREVLDSRGNPTVEAEVALADGTRGRAAVPSGASTGAHEACELRDGGARFGGKGVAKAVAHAKGPLADAVRGRDPGDLAGLDRALRAADGTANLGRLGANAVLAVSLAAAHAAAAAAKTPLYRFVGERFGDVLPENWSTGNGGFPTMGREVGCAGRNSVRSRSRRR